MRRRIDLVIKDLRERADFINSKIVFVTPGIVTDGMIMSEAADRLQAVEILEKELEEAQEEIASLKKEAKSVRSKLKRKGILIE
jgi:SMC interacting uncharacterized protein involved in chromosome segregation